MNEWILEDIVEVEEVGWEDTFDLEVDHPEHTFYANGISVSNSHAICYSILSYQCAWLLNYYPSEWCCSFLDKEPEDRKESAISLVKSYDFQIKELDINLSGVQWEVHNENQNILVQPLSSVKGLGDAAINEIMSNRPFHTVEELLFSDKVAYNKLNKRGLDALCRSGALKALQDERFSGDKHFWSVVAVDRPKSLKKLKENIELYRPEGSFTDEERIEHMTALSGVYPLNLVVGADMLKKLADKDIKPLGEHQLEGASPLVWFVARSKEVKTTKNGKPYWIVSMTDSTNTLTEVKCWGIRETDVIHMNRLYMGKIQKDSYGYSIRNFKEQIRLLN